MPEARTNPAGRRLNHIGGSADEARGESAPPNLAPRMPARPSRAPVPTRTADQQAMNEGRSPKKEVQFARMSPEHMELLAKCKIWSKLKSDELHSISMHNVSELVNVLIQSDATGEEVAEVDKDDLMQLTKLPNLGQLTDQDITNLVLEADKDQNGRVSVTELHKAFTEGSVAFALLKKSLQGKKELKPNAVTKKELVEYMEEEYDTKSALFSLPSTFTIFLCFFAIVTHHLRVRNAFMMQEAIQGSIEGEGKPYLQEYVHDIRSFWEWMESSGVGVLFKNDLDEWPYPGRMESFNQIIGAVQLVKHDVEATSPCKQADVLNYFYDSSNGLCHRGTTYDVSRFLFYQQMNQELTDEVIQIKNEHWLSQNTSSMDMVILFYNAYLQMFTMMEMVATFEFDGEGRRDGLMQKVFYMESFLADPYYNWGILIFDLAFIALLLRMFVEEVKEMLTSLSAGLDGFVSYWEVWNVIDWISIVVGFALMGIWMRLVLTITGEFRGKIAALPNPMLDQEVLHRRAYLPMSDIENMLSVDDFNLQILDLHNAGRDIADLHRWFRFIIFFYAMVLMMKFFKAFRANPRLNIVIDTMLEATTDLLHFSVVFTVIFLVFSLMGCVAFGARIEAFSDQLRAVIISWRILMGEDITEDMELVHRNLARFWVLIFTSLVLLILLNMLLAIIMDKYSLVYCKANDPATIWRQTIDAVQDLRDTRSHVDLFKVIIRMTDPDSTAAQTSNITVRSLRRFFESERMTRSNAEYLISRCQQYIENKGEDNELGIMDAVRIIGTVQVMIRKILASTSDVQKDVHELVRRPMDQRMDSILAGFDPEGSVMEPKMNFPKRVPILTGMDNDTSPKEQKLSTPVNNMRGPQEKQALGLAAATAGPRKLAPVPPAANIPEFAAMQLDGMPSQEFPSWQTDAQENSQQMGAVLTAIADTLGRIEQRLDHTQSRQDFIESKLGSLNKKSESSERILKNLNDAVSGFNWKTLADLPEQMNKQMRAAAMVVASATYPLDGEEEQPGINRAAASAFVSGTDPLDRGEEQPGSLKQQSKSTFDGESHRGGGGSPKRGSMPFNPSIGPSVSQASSVVDGTEMGPPPIARGPFQRRIEQCILKVNEQLAVLRDHAEEATNSREMLWQIELTLRKMTKASEAAHTELHAATDKLDKFLQGQSKGQYRGMRASERQFSKAGRPSMAVTAEEESRASSRVPSEAGGGGPVNARMSMTSTGDRSAASQAARGEPEFTLPHRPQP